MSYRRLSSPVALAASFFATLYVAVVPAVSEAQSVNSATHVCGSKVGGGLALEGYNYILAEFNMTNLSFLLVPWSARPADIDDARISFAGFAEPSYVVEEMGIDRSVAICDGTPSRLYCRHFAGGVSYWNLETLKFELLLASGYTMPEGQGRTIAGAVQGTCQKLPEL